jgi:type I restriction enzyme M protein
LHHITKSKISSVDNYIQTAEITDLMLAVGKIKKGESIYNPFAGLASFGVVAEKENLYIGQEISKRAWALGQLRLMAFDRLNARYLCEDSINNWPDNSRKFDIIITSPPLNLDLRSKYIKGEFINTYRTAEQFVIEQSLNNLKKDGKLIVCVSSGFLNRSHGEEHIITHLIENDLLETIIPFQKHSSMIYAVLVVNKNKKNTGKVAMYNTAKFVQKKNDWETEFNFNQLIDFIEENKEDNEVIKLVDNDEIRKNDFILNVPRYFQHRIDGIRLGEIICLIKGERINTPLIGKLIRTRDLKERDIDFSIDLSKVEETELNRSVVNKISESCLLLATRWKSLKPSFFYYSGAPLFKSNDIQAFKIDESKVDLAYLINELSAEYVVKQLDAVRMGAVIPYVRITDLLEVRIKLPSLKEQKAKVQGINQLANKIKELQIERNALAHGIRNKQFDEFASLKHTLGTPRQNILGWSKNLSKFFEKENEAVAMLNKNFKELFGLRIEEAISEINRDINFISEVLEKGEKGLVLTNYPLTFVSLKALNEVVSSISDNGWKFSLKKEILNNEELDSRGLEINLTLFRALMDNILTNANKYGFKEKKEGNLVQIELIENGGYIIIEVSNNGLPFPKNFDREKFITKYSTADSLNGTGLGGYDIDRIATYFDNSNWELILNKDMIYRVIFRFRFPIKLTF